MFILTVLVARYLGQAGLGQYTFVAALVFLGNVLTTFGLDTILIREVARRGTASATTLTAALGIQLGLAALFIGGVTLASGWLQDGPCCVSAKAVGLWVYSLSLIPLAFTTTFSASLRAYERMDLILALNLLSAAAQTGGAWVILSAGGGLVLLLGLLLAIQTLSAALSGLMCFGWLPGFALDLRVSPVLARHLLRQGIPLVLVAGSMVAYQRLGVLMLSWLAGDAATGWYAAAGRVTDALKMAHYAFFGAIFPLMSRLVVDGQHPGASQDPTILEHQLSHISLRFWLGFGLLAALIITLLAGPAVRLIYGQNYAPAIPALRILAWSLVPFAVNTHTFFWLVSRGKEISALRVSLVSVGSTVALHAMLIPSLGLLGACLATLVGELIQAVLYLPYTRQGDTGTGRAVPLKDQAWLGARDG
jgi:O-antigen/teichoic acid export membrane protein